MNLDRLRARWMGVCLCMLSFYVMSLTLLSFSTAWSDAGSTSEIPCVDATIVGHVTSQSYTELPENPGQINMDVLWNLDVTVNKVLKGAVSTR